VSPTARTLALLRSRGYRAAVVEHWNPYAKIRQDLFGCLDIVAVGLGRTLGVQTTSGSNVAARVAKLQNAEAVPELLNAGWLLLVVGWRKAVNGRWTWRAVKVSEPGPALPDDNAGSAQSAAVLSDVAEL
jgi:hypothetical protein